MFGLKKITTTVTYKVEKGPYCNFYIMGSATPDKKNACRFCVKNKQGGHSCAMYNELLSEQNGIVNKLQTCMQAMCKGTDTVEDLAAIAVAYVDPSKMTANIIKQYQDTVDSLVGQGFPQDVATNAAKQMLTTKGDVRVSTRG